MLTTIQFVPGAVTAGANISLPTWAPKIDVVFSASIIRPTNQITLSSHGTHSHTENTAATYTQNALTDTAVVTDHTINGANPIINATPTKVDESTITLNVATQLGDMLVLSYIPIGAKVRI